jgi:Tfp pilus assembly protein PilF
MNRNKYGRLYGKALLLLVFSLVGCAPHSAAPNAITPSEGHSAKQLPTRVIIYFQRPTADNKSLSAAISEACHCQPVFFRQYSNDALIYIIALQQDHTFASFEKALMLNAAQLGIKSMEQDSLQHL